MEAHSVWEAWQCEGDVLRTWYLNYVTSQVGKLVCLTAPGSSAEVAWHKHTKQQPTSRELERAQIIETPSVTLQPEVRGRTYALESVSVLPKGSVTMKVAPRPSSLSTVSVPPCPCVTMS